jgi:hypothetical protein
MKCMAKSFGDEMCCEGGEMGGLGLVVCILRSMEKKY